MVEPHNSNFRVIITNFLGVRIFRKFTVFTSEKTGPDWDRSQKWWWQENLLQQKSEFSEFCKRTIKQQSNDILASLTTWIRSIKYNKNLFLGPLWPANTPTPLKPCNCNGISVTSYLQSSCLQTSVTTASLIVSQQTLLKLCCMKTWLSAGCHIIFITDTILLLQTQIKGIPIKFWVVYKTFPSWIVLTVFNITHTNTWSRRLYMSRVTRKPVLAIYKQQRSRSACTSAQSDQRLYYSLPRQYNASFYYTKFQASSLASVSVQAGLCLTSSQTPKTGFLVTGLIWLLSIP